jgi:hypothetical protein
MTFEDLPSDWPQRPVTDLTITADLLDLVVSERDRATGALGVLLCGRDERLLQPLVVEMPGYRLSAAERRRGFDNICAVSCHLGEPTGSDEAEAVNGGLGILFALARSGSPLVTSGDLRWRDTAEQSCQHYGVALLGTWLVTPEVIRPLPPAAASRRSA